MVKDRRRLLRLGVLDAVLVAALLFLPVRTLLARRRAEPAAVRITQAGRLVGVYRLDRDARVRLNSGVVIEIRGGAVRVAESDCPKGICRHTGWVRQPGRTIVCVPNRVAVEVTGEPGGIDAESY